MKTDEIRKKYLDYFKRKDHVLVGSDSLVPANDPTLLFTGAGMNQFKENFLGIKKDLKRATSSQKCLRAGDLEEVGRTAYHHSFFEMLGNFSFGDYFKEGAIEMAWEFLTQDLKLDPKRLRVSVHKSDDEAFNYWKDKIKIRPDWIYKLGDKDNFWPANAPTDGPNGPCGPCSEIYYDQNPSLGEGGDLEQKFTDDKGTHKRFAEIWNLVFTQYDRQDGGKLVPLAQKNIDTGMGLERLACMLQSKNSNYEIDTLDAIVKATESELKVSNLPENLKYSVYAITDHLRAVTMCMADGVIPSNEGRGYVIRKLIRRALWHGHKVIAPRELQAPFLYKVLPTVIKVMGVPYPEIKQAEHSISQMLKAEEERFLELLENGLKILQTRLKSLKGKTIPGEVVFELYDTYGFPDELTRKIAEEKGLTIDQDGFDKAMEDQRKRAKETGKMKGDIFAATDLEKGLTSVPPTEFQGYDNTEWKSKILYQQIQGNTGVLVLDHTPFYGESGGQTGDKGTIEGSGFKARVLDAQKKDKHVIHLIEIVSGQPKNGDTVTAKIDEAQRARAMRNHTATHLLHAALRNILGPQVRQLGSLVAPEKLRFDYSYGQALTADQLKQIEDSVNAEILKDTAVTKEEKDIEEAKKDGAIAFFGEKYGARVRIVTVPGFSKEFCGGTHCDRTGQIGSFVIVSDSSIASGTRRIEALTGEGALEYLRNLRAQMNLIVQTLKTTPDKAVERAQKLQDSVKKLEKEIEKGGAASTSAAEEKAVPIGSYTFKALYYRDLSVDALRKRSDDIRSGSTKTVFFIGTETGDKLSFLVAASGDIAKKEDVRDLGKKISEILGGSGGGRPDMFQGGAPNNKQLGGSIDLIVKTAQTSLAGK